ncbi:MAG: alpha/beta fold hydrolase [Planctomycetia bacterium]|jgi:pimeloyl-ACP methyl ester carboxylesterase|nr:alpha/beta fold hydrolase [Planctomycetia bacterium]MCC7313387.1 alpha/beta fold hydrolase [Planctomycetota bacterium]OQZ01689.1 MAG: hypothetical protein B6D36_13845 [Planctomycetes bacterium UTPLA1]
MSDQSQGSPLFVQESGDESGAPILFIHGFPLTGQMWEPAIAQMPEEYRCIIPDLRGLGESDVSGRPSMTAYADDLAGLLDDIGEKRPVVVVALSMGGYVAFEFFRRHRASTKALALIDTRANADSAEARAGRMKMIESVRTSGSKAVADAMIKKLFAANVDPELKQEWYEIMSSQPPEGVIGALQAMADRPDSTPTLASIDCPTVFICGEHDVITPPDVHREMHAAVPGSRLEIVAESGHLTPLERTDEFTNILCEFLETLE